MSRGISDTCRDHRNLSPPVKNNTQNEPAGQVDLPTRVEVRMMGDPGQCRDYRCLTACQKQHSRMKQLVR